VTLFDDAPTEPSAPGSAAAPATAQPSVRVRMQVAYDGRAFHGFAAQALGVRTVAGVLAAALERVLRLAEAPELVCAGRTDAGVHAWDQWVHADVPEGVDTTDLHRRLVKLLAPEIVVRAVDIAPPEWHARFSARSRTYRYTVLITDVPDPFRAGLVWWHPQPLDLRAMNLACDALIGEHDFSSFCRKQGDASLVRCIHDAAWTAPSPEDLRFEVTANAFCQQMVRSLVGTLVEIGAGKRKAGEMLSIVRAADRAAAATVAPPDGLVLWQVDY
jgi:tRNA pseudouridine38-40 synthase